MHFKGYLSDEDTLFRIFFFRLLNKIETWTELEKRLGEVSLNNFNLDKYSKVLTKMKEENPIYGNAFILCANKVFGFDEKHNNHLALLKKVFTKDNLINDIIKAKSFEDLFLEFRKLPLIGNFMAYQIAIDFTIEGPGAIRGINKCFSDIKPNVTGTP